MKLAVHHYRRQAAQADAKKTVARLIEQLGFAGIDLGTLDGGGRLAQFPGGAPPVLNLVKFS